MVVLVSQAHKDDPWMAHDVGAAWAAGIPVVPVLVGKWDSEPPNILAPYQRIQWDSSVRSWCTNWLFNSVSLRGRRPMLPVRSRLPARRRPRDDSTCHSMAYGVKLRLVPGNVIVQSRRRQAVVSSR